MKILNTATPPGPLHLLLIAFLGLGVFVAPGLTPLSLWAQEAQRADTVVDDAGPEPDVDPESVADLRPVEGVEQPPPSRRIFWELTDPPVAYFLPQEVLAQVPFDDLPISKGGYFGLRRELKKQQVLRLWNQSGDLRAACEEVDPEGRCGIFYSVPERAAQTGLPEFYIRNYRESGRRAFERERRERTSRGCIPAAVDTVDTMFESLAELLEYGDDMFVGEVVETIDGWNRRGDQPTTAIYVRVDTVVRSKELRRWPGEIVVFQENYGSVTVAGVELCSEITEQQGLLVPLAVGDQILVQGSHSDDAEHLIRTVVSPIVESYVLSRGRQVPYLPISVAELAERIENGGD